MLSDTYKIYLPFIDVSTRYVPSHALRFVPSHASDQLSHPPQTLLVLLLHQQQSQYSICDPEPVYAT